MEMLHFSLGNDIANRITEIAQETLLYEYNPDKAVKIFTNVLIGCPYDLAVRCLSGKDLKLVVTGDDINLTTADIKDYPAVDFYKFVYPWINEFRNIYNIFVRQLKVHLTSGHKFRHIIFDIDICELLKSYYNWDMEPDDFLNNYIIEHRKDIFDDDNDYNKCVDDLRYFRLFKKWKQLNVKRFGVIRFLIDNKLIDNQDICIDDLENKLVAESEIIEHAISGIVKDADELKLKPISPTEFRNACWISPEGVIYGLNGEIDDMLHIEMANMLVSQGTVKAQTLKQEHNAYLILEQSGWAKLNNNWIIFEPDVYISDEHKKQFITPVQQERIAQYLHIHYSDIGKFGILHHKVSSFMFKQMDQFAINKLFNF